MENSIELTKKIRETLELTKVIEKNHRTISRFKKQASLSYIPRKILKVIIIYAVFIYISNFASKKSYLLPLYQKVSDTTHLYDNIVIALIIILFSLLYIYNFVKAKPKVRRAKLKINEVKKEIEAIIVIHDYFLNSKTLERFIHYLETGLADNLKECYNLHEQERLNGQVLSTIRSSAAQVAATTRRGIEEIKEEMRD